MVVGIGKSVDLGELVAVKKFGDLWIEELVGCEEVWRWGSEKDSQRGMC